MHAIMKENSQFAHVGRAVVLDLCIQMVCLRMPGWDDPLARIYLYRGCQGRRTQPYCPCRPRNVEDDIEC